MASELRRQADGSFSGALYRTTGVPLARIDGQPAANFPPTPVGVASLNFVQATRGTFTYTLDNVHQSRTIQRQSFSTPTTCRPTRGDRLDATNYQDLWWQPSEPGWGLNVAHQGETLFATWFTYGEDGRGQWLVASDVRRQPTGEYRGRLYRTQGVYFAAIAGAATSTPPVDVGEVTLTFANGENGRLDYVVDGVAQSKAIQRQVFGSTRPLCR